MKHQFEITGPLTIAAMLRSSDMTVIASEEVTTAVITVEPRRGAEDLAERTRVELVGNRLVIEVPKPEGFFFGSSGSVVIEAVVPVGSSLEAESGSGDVRGRGRLARAEVRNGSGDVELEDAGDARIRSGSGDVTLADIGMAVLSSGSGDIRVRRAAGRTDIHTGSGDVLVNEATELTVETGSGDAVVDNGRGALRLTTGSGDLTVRHAGSGEVTAKTASGDVIVGVPHGTAALLDCSTVSGRVRSDLASGDEPAGEEARVVLRLRSVSGDVRVQRA